MLRGEVGACRFRRCSGTNWEPVLHSRWPPPVWPPPARPAASPAWSTLGNEGSCGARAQGRPSNRKSEHHLQVHRAAAPTPCAAVWARRQQKRLGRGWSNVIWNCRIYIWIQLQLGKLRTYAVRLNRKLDKFRLESRLCAARRTQPVVSPACGPSLTTASFDDPLMPSALPSLRGSIIEPADFSCIVVMPGRSGIVKSPGNLSMKQTCPA